MKLKFWPLKVNLKKIVFEIWKLKKFDFSNDQFSNDFFQFIKKKSKL